MDDVFCVVRNRLRDEVVAIEVCAFDGDEDVAGLDEARVGAYIRAIGRANKIQ